MVEASDIDSVLGSDRDEDQRVPDFPLSKYSVLFALKPDRRDRADRLPHTRRYCAPNVNSAHPFCNAYNRVSLLAIYR